MDRFTRRTTEAFCLLIECSLAAQHRGDVFRGLQAGRDIPVMCARVLVSRGLAVEVDGKHRITGAGIQLAAKYFEKDSEGNPTPWMRETVLAASGQAAALGRPAHAARVQLYGA